MVDNGQTPEDTISSPCEPHSSCELKGCIRPKVQSVNKKKLCVGLT